MHDFYKNILMGLNKNSFFDYSDDARFSFTSIDQSYESCVHLFDVDFKKSFDDLSYIFSDLSDGKSQTERSILFMREHIEGDQSVSMVALIAAAFAHFNIRDEKWCQAALGAAVYAGIPHELQYHNKAHFKKVVLHMVRLIAAHNYIFQDTSNFLDHDKIALLLIAAAVHDLGHEGTGNIIDRKYYIAKAERKSFDIISPYLKSCGISDDDINDLLVLLVATDVSPFGDPMSPANQVRNTYDVHFGSSEDDGGDCEVFEISPELYGIEGREHLCMMALMLHEADILNSAAVSYDTTVAESRAVSLEIGRQHALPEDTLLFLDKICNGQMCSAAAQFIASDNMDDIKERVLADYSNGNKSYL